jgi:hypothetical protein
MIEQLGNQRVFTIKKNSNGRKEVFGRCNFPKEMVGLKFIVKPLTKNEIKSIKKVNKKDEKYF